MRNNATAISYKGTLQAVRKNTAGVNAGGVDTNSDYADTKVRTTKRHGRRRHREGQTRTRLLKTRKASRLWITCKHDRLCVDIVVLGVVISVLVLNAFVLGVDISVLVYNRILAVDIAVLRRQYKGGGVQGILSTQAKGGMTGGG